MKDLSVVLLMIVSGFSQVNWELEIVEPQVTGAYLDCIFNTIAVSSNNTPHCIYNREGFSKIIHASRNDSGWQKEEVESGLSLCYGFSLIFDKNDILHLSYACKFDSLGKTYICHAYRQYGGWIINYVDSIRGHLGNYFWDFNTSIDLDASDLPGIAYIAWNIEDSLHYIKYAHFNGTNWDTSVVEYDSAHTEVWPTDWSPSLKFSDQNTPYIAFHQILGHNDTIKIAYFADSLNAWVISPAVCEPYGGYPVSLALNSLDYPCIAHGLSVMVAYSWWDGSSWHTESTNASMGWIGVRIILDLDSLDNPHIAYLPDPTIGHPSYCYKKDAVWHLCGWIEPDPSVLTIEADISFVLDNNDQPHVCYQYGSGSNGLKYAKGTFVGVTEEQIPKTKLRFSMLDIDPNPFCIKTHIYYDLAKQTSVEIVVYDVSGRQVKTLVSTTQNPGYYTLSWDGSDDYGRLSSAGVYFLSFQADKHNETRQLILIR